MPVDPTTRALVRHSPADARPASVRLDVQRIMRSRDQQDSRRDADCRMLRRSATSAKQAFALREAREGDGGSVGTHTTADGLLYVRWLNGTRIGVWIVAAASLLWISCSTRHATTLPSLFPAHFLLRLPFDLEVRDRKDGLRVGVMRGTTFFAFLMTGSAS